MSDVNGQLNELTASDEPAVVEYKIQMICVYFLHGVCRFGERCYYVHELPEDEEMLKRIMDTLPTCPGVATEIRNWANAPVFVPKRNMQLIDTGDGSAVVVDEGIDFEVCDMCNEFCLHPTDQKQRSAHYKECLHAHEEDMKFSFALAVSKEKQCGICLETVMNPSRFEKRFGILQNCTHTFCLSCIRTWRSTDSFASKVRRSCPECRTSSNFICASEIWIESKEQKNKLFQSYRAALRKIDCKYFKMGEGTCQFGNRCFYRHMLPNGTFVNVGRPRRTRMIIAPSDDDEIDDYLNEINEFIANNFRQPHMHFLFNDSAGSSDSE